MNPRRRVVAIAVAAVGLVAFGALVASKVDLAAVGLALRGASRGPVLAAVGVMLGVIALSVVKIQVVCAAGGLRVDLGRAARALLSAAALNPLIPGRGGELVKVFVLAPSSDRRWDAFAIVVVERLFDLSVVASGALIAGAVGGEWGAVAAGALVLGAVVGVGLGGSLVPRLGDRFARSVRALGEMKRRPHLVVRAWAVTAVVWTGNVLILGLMLQAAGAQATWGQVAYAAPVAILAGMLPISVAGLGTREAALLLVLGAHLPHPPLVAASLLYTACTVGVSWAVGAVALAGGWVIRPPVEQGLPESVSETGESPGP